MSLVVTKNSFKPRPRRELVAKGQASVPTAHSADSHPRGPRVPRVPLPLVHRPSRQV